MIYLCVCNSPPCLKTDCVSSQCGGACVGENILFSYVWPNDSTVFIAKKTQSSLNCQRDVYISSWKDVVNMYCTYSCEMNQHIHTHTCFLTTESIMKLHPTISMLSTMLLMGLHWATSAVNCGTKYTHILYKLINCIPKNPKYCSIAVYCVYELCQMYNQFEGVER